MIFSSRLVPLISTGVVSMALLACGRSTQSRDASSLPGSGGSTGDGQTDAPRASDGATGGFGIGGAPGAGGGPDLGGGPRSGGSTGTAGSSGGTTTRSGGASGSGGAGGTGGKTVGSGGLSGFGGRSTGGQTTASGGTVSDGGGSVGVDGGSGVVTFPPKFFGNIDTYGAIRSDFASMWDQFTPENAGHWESMQPSSSTFNWKTLDAMYQYCDDNHITFRQTSFISGDAPPAWLDATTARTAAPALMKAFCDRYPKTRVIDVVNEPIHAQPSYLQGLGGRGASGYDWVAQSFNWAREACPNAVLAVNDYNIIEYAGDHKNFLELMKAMKDLNAPIMAVGAEGRDAYKVSRNTVATYLADIVSQTGLPVYISGFEIGLKDDGEQATSMKDLVTIFWGDPNVLGITYWGYIVGKTWRSNTGLMQEDGTKRPALTWLMDFLGRQ